MGLAIEIEGTRAYITGDSYAYRTQLKSAGCHWDGDRKQWWIGVAKRANVEAIVTGPAPESAPQREQREAPGEDAAVAGRATYKGKTYYVAGRIERGRTRYDDHVRPVETRDGAKVLLYFRDGSSSFWAARSEVQVVRSYQRPTTIARLRAYAEEAKSHGTDECSCRCHREPNAGRPGSTLYDGCDRCGCESCG